MQDLMHACWVSFAKTGAPQCAAWPAYEPARGEAMVFGPKTGVEDHFRQPQYDALEQASLPTLGMAAP
jgi:para-nitrobenzyl esterase